MSGLTKAREQLLRELKTEGPRPVVPYYPPVKWLVDAGLARWRDSRRLEITDAGRAALSPTQGTKP